MTYAALAPLRDSRNFSDKGEKECRSDRVFHVVFEAGKEILRVVPPLLTDECLSTPP
jgi:hypothetical protein